ncbi:restriction endonuclease [Brevibacterium oceani]|uniref:restriction endonuclease n=1 Tax=Brevibacterium oceani TaxID=358099 RepID=UPI001B329FFC|nr:restriction endonuclease [Brevibacterium oceani]
MAADYIQLVHRCFTDPVDQVKFTDEKQVGEFILTYFVLCASPDVRGNDHLLINAVKEALEGRELRDLIRPGDQIRMDSDHFKEILKILVDVKSELDRKGLSVNSDASIIGEYSTALIESEERSPGHGLSDEQLDNLLREILASRRYQVDIDEVRSVLEEVLSDFGPVDIGPFGVMSNDKDVVMYRVSRRINKASAPRRAAHEPYEYSGVERQLSIAQILSNEHMQELISRLQAKVVPPVEEEVVREILVAQLDRVKLNASTTSQSAMDRFGEKMFTKALPHVRSASNALAAEIEKQARELEDLARRKANRDAWKDYAAAEPATVGEIGHNDDRMLWQNATVARLIGKSYQSSVRSVAVAGADSPEFRALPDARKEAAINFAVGQFLSMAVSPENLDPVEFFQDFSSSMSTQVTAEVRSALRLELGQFVKEQEDARRREYVASWTEYSQRNKGWIGLPITNSIGDSELPIDRFVGGAFVSAIKEEFARDLSNFGEVEKMAFSWAIEEICDSRVAIEHREPEEVVDEIRTYIEDRLPLVFAGQLNRAKAKRDEMAARMAELAPRASASLYRRVMMLRNEASSSLVWLHDEAWWEDLCRQFVATLSLESIELMDTSASEMLQVMAQQVIESVIAGRESELRPKAAALDPSGRARAPKQVPAFRSIESPRDFEDLSREWMVWLGFPDAVLTASGADGGIDVIAEDGAAQVKQYAAQVSAPEVRQFAGAMMGYPDKSKLFFASSRFSTPAVDFANLPQVEMALFQVITDRGSRLEPFSRFADELLRSARESS